MKTSSIIPAIINIPLPSHQTLDPKEKDKLMRQIAEFQAEKTLKTGKNGSH